MMDTARTSKNYICRKKNQTEEEDVLDLKQLEQALFSARELTVLIPVTWLAQHLFKTTQ